MTDELKMPPPVKDLTPRELAVLPRYAQRHYAAIHERMDKLEAIAKAGHVTPPHPREDMVPFLKVDAGGRGKCLAPVFRAVGTGITTCGQEAYGEQMHEHMESVPQRFKGLACPDHGGPPSRVFRDGTEWCAVMPDFVNLEESEAGFAATPERARWALEAGLCAKRVAQRNTARRDGGE